MLKLDRLSLSDFLLWESVSLPFREGVTFIHGRNGSGKTMLVQAMATMLWGFGAGKRGTDSGRWPKGAGGTLKFQSGGHAWELHAQGTKLGLSRDGKSLRTLGSKAARELLRSKVIPGVTQEIFDSTILVGSGLNPLTAASPLQRADWFSSVFGLDADFDPLLEEAQRRLALAVQAKTRVDLLREQVATLRDRLKENRKAASAYPASGNFRAMDAAQARAREAREASAIKREARRSLPDDMVAYVLGEAKDANLRLPSEEELEQAERASEKARDALAKLREASARAKRERRAREAVKRDRATRRNAIEALPPASVIEAITAYLSEAREPDEPCPTCGAVRERASKWPRSPRVNLGAVRRILSEAKRRRSLEADDRAASDAEDRLLASDPIAEPPIADLSLAEERLRAADTRVLELRRAVSRVRLAQSLRDRAKALPEEAWSLDPDKAEDEAISLRREAERAAAAHAALSASRFSLIETYAKLRKYRRAARSVPALEILTRAYGRSGLRIQFLRDVAETFENALNDGVPLLWPDSYRFHVRHSDRGIELFLSRGENNLTDLSVLSGSQQRVWKLLCARALVRILPPHVRCDTIVLDEPEANMDSRTRDMLVNNFIPALREAVPNIVIISPQSADALPMHRDYTFSIASTGVSSTLVER